MRAQVFHGPGDLRDEQVPVPEPGPGELLLGKPDAPYFTTVGVPFAVQPDGVMTLLPLAEPTFASAVPFTTRFVPNETLRSRRVSSGSTKARGESRRSVCERITNLLKKTVKNPCARTS